MAEGGNKARQADWLQRRRASQPVRGMSLVMAAAYIGIQPFKFEALLRQQRLPPARLIDGVQVWDVDELDRAFETFPRKGAEAATPPRQPWEADREGGEGEQ